MTMRMTLLAGAALTCVALAIPVHAADLYTPPPETDYEPPPTDNLYEMSAWYLALRGGASFATDTSFDALGTTVDSGYDIGPFVAGAVGYHFQNTGLRAEAEIGYLTNAIEHHDIAGTGTFTDDASGDSSAFFGLASIYYDLPLDSRIKPFVGAGIGLADVSFSGLGTTPGGTLLDDSDTAFAWHLTGGIGYDISENVALEVGYRYLAFDGVDVTASDGTPSSIDTSDHIVFAGLRYRF